MMQQRILRGTRDSMADLGAWINHYKMLFWRWKWFICAAIPLTGFLAGFVAFKILSLHHEQSATITIGIDNPGRASAVGDFSAMGNSRIEILRSRTFLQSVVKELSLTLRVYGYNRSSIFDSCEVEQGARTGNYKLQFNRENPLEFVIFYADPGKPFLRREKSTAKLSETKPLVLPGAVLHWNTSFVRTPRSFSFSVMTEREAVDELIAKMNIIMPNPLQDRDYLTVSLRGTDYELIATTLNTMANRFIDRAQDMRGRRNREALVALEKQLAEADGNRQRAETMLRDFLTANPSVGLTSNISPSISRLVTSQSERAALIEQRDEAQRLFSSFTSAAPQDRLPATQEILTFLSFSGDQHASIILADLNRLITESQTTLQGYADDHPLVEENRAAIARIVRQSASALRTFSDKTERAINITEGSIKDLAGSIQLFPAKQRKIAELQSRQQIEAQLYTEILQKYNQAKVAKVSEVPDAYIMDYAVPPLPPQQWLLVLILIISAGCIGCAVGFGVPAAIDYFDPTARTEFDLRRRTGLLLAESIPDLRLTSRWADPVPSRSEPEILPFSNGYTGELFRSLRTKLFLSMHGSTHNTIVVVSLAPSEGKSTVASHLALAMARQNMSTIVIDADLRRGSVSEKFNVASAPGLADLFNPTTVSLKESVERVIRRTGHPNLFLITSGKESSSPVESLGSARMAEIHQLLAKEFDIIIIDTPPLGIGTDAVVLHKFASRYIAVALAGKTPVSALEKNIERFPVIREKLFGIVLNRATMNAHRDYKRYLRYYHQPIAPEIITNTDLKPLSNSVKLRFGFSLAHTADNPLSRAKE